MGKRKYDPRSRYVRARRGREKIKGVPERPRLSVFRSSKHIHAQLIEDVSGRTLVHASSVEQDLRGTSTQGKMEQAVMVGKALAERSKKLGVSKIVFDRSGYKYHGRVKQLAEAARSEGLVF